MAPLAFVGMRLKPPRPMVAVRCLARCRGPLAWAITKVQSCSGATSNGTSRSPTSEWTLHANGRRRGASRSVLPVTTYQREGRHIVATNDKGYGRHGAPVGVNRRPEWADTRPRIGFALVVATAIAVALGVVGLTLASSTRSDVGFEMAKAGIQLFVIAVVGQGVAAEFRKVEDTRDERRRQEADHLGKIRRERELKTGLVSEISKCVMTFAMELVRSHKRDGTPNKKRNGRGELEEAYNAYRVSSAVIGTKLEAYFGGMSRVPRDWDLLTGAFAVVYELEIEDDPGKQRLLLNDSGEHIDDLRSVAGDVLDQLRNAIGHSEETATVEGDSDYTSAWNALKEDRLLPHKARLIRAVLEQPMADW